jgi:plastocyanin
MNTRSAILTSVLAAVACGGGSSMTSSNSSGGGPQISIQDYSFSPSVLTVKTGTTVTWSNLGPSAHTVVSDSNAFSSQTLAAPGGGGAYGGGDTNGGAYRFTFMTPGTYAYHCSVHPPSMHPGFTGTITVTQ